MFNIDRNNSSPDKDQNGGTVGTVILIIVLIVLIVLAVIALNKTDDSINEPATPVGVSRK